jgi:EAL domain-containing protein (putative c-di-GMP-specific phosphodiesterase class I)
MRASLMSRLQLETDLRYAVERGELQNVYQPIVALDTGEIAGFEALMRWHHPVRGIISPEEFIPVAEDTGQIRELGWWNLKEACRQLREWRKQGEFGAGLTISVNLSAKQLQQPNLPAEIGELLREMELPSGSLCLELTFSSGHVED